MVNVLVDRESSRRANAIPSYGDWNWGAGLPVPRAPAGPTGCRQRGEVRPRAARQGQARGVRRRLTLGRLAAWGWGLGPGHVPRPRPRPLVTPGRRIAVSVGSSRSRT